MDELAAATATGPIVSDGHAERLAVFLQALPALGTGGPVAIPVKLTSTRKLFSAVGADVPLGVLFDAGCRRVCDDLGHYTKGWEEGPLTRSRIAH